MIEVQRTINIEPVELVDKVYQLHSEGYRLAQINCSKIGEGLEFNYSFDKEMEFLNLRLNTSLDVELTSVSGIYLAAMLYENEIHDLYGVNVKHMKIDYQGNLYRTAVKTPFI